jgi:hypothetical protein
MTDDWYYHKEGIAQGPLNAQSMAALHHAGDIDGQTLIWQPNLEHWQTVAQLQPAWSLPAASPSTKPTAPAGSEPVRPAIGFFKRLFGRKS